MLCANSYTPQLLKVGAEYGQEFEKSDVINLLSHISFEVQDRTKICLAVQQMRIIQEWS